jgi:hypothetical protein
MLGGSKRNKRKRKETVFKCVGYTNDSKNAGLVGNRAFPGMLPGCEFVILSENA